MHSLSLQDLPAAQQTSVDVQPTRTRYTFQAWQCSDIVCLVSERALWYLMRHDGDDDHDEFHHHDDDHCHQYHHTARYSMIHRCHCYIVIHDDASWCSVVHVTSHHDTSCYVTIHHDTWYIIHDDTAMSWPGRVCGDDRGVHDPFLWPWWGVAVTLWLRFLAPSWIPHVGQRTVGYVHQLFDMWMYPMQQ